MTANTIRAQMKTLQTTDLIIPAGLAILLFLFGLDIATTEFILQNGGYEMNILMQSVVSSGLFHVFVKLIVFLVTGLIVICSNSKIKNSGTITLYLIIGWYLIVALHNLHSITGFF